MTDVAALLARVTAALPGGGEARPGQVAMAEAVAKAIASERHVVVQAGTGTGKSLAYLVPAIAAERRVVVATATKALQDQLAGKDLPFLQRASGRDFDVAVVKGRSNYICVQRVREVGGGATPDDADRLQLEDVDGAERKGFAAQVKELLAFAATTTTGDRAELAVEPHPRAWAQVSVNAMECPGAANCPSGGACFAERARQAASEADVVVVNTHLYGAHLASGGHVLPEHDVVVFDEAHELEDIASSALGLELGHGRFASLARSARPVVASPGDADDLLSAGDRIERAVTPFHGRRLPADLGEDVVAALELAAERVRRCTAALRSAEERTRGQGELEARRLRAMQAAGHLAGDLALVLARRKSDVAWVEGQPHSPVLRIAPVDVAAALAEQLWGNVTAVLTSATIPAHLPVRLGLPAGEVDELDVGSPFDFERQGLLYCARHLPDPRHPDHEAAMHRELVGLIRAAGGRTLALFTSWRAMEAAAAAVRDAVPFRILTQSELPKPALVRAFSEDESSCLFATMGFWQGVDVPGSACSQVVIDRIPFPRPDEPLLQARRDRAGPAAFRTIDLPRAATLLAQGAGRLIRTAEDRGVVAVLDARLATAGYRWDLVRALPPMRRTRHLADVEAFWQAS